MFQKNGYGYVVISKDGNAYDGTLMIKQGAERGYPLGEEPAKTADKPKKKADAPKTVAKKAEVAKKKSETDERTPEQQAASKLNLAKDILMDGKKDKAKVRLEEIVEKYPDTKAATEARELLKNLEP